MTTSTRVEVLAPRRPLDDSVADESLPADLTVQVGSAGAPIAASVPLQEFVASAANLSHAQRMTIVQQALLLLEGNYVHLPLKAAMHAVSSPEPRHLGPMDGPDTSLRRGAFTFVIAVGVLRCGGSAA